MKPHPDFPPSSVAAVSVLLVLEETSLFLLLIAMPAHAATPNVADTVLRHKTPSSSPGHSRPTSFSSSGGDQSDEGPCPPPRLASVWPSDLPWLSLGHRAHWIGLQHTILPQHLLVSPLHYHRLVLLLCVVVYVFHGCYFTQLEPIDTGKQRSVKDIMDIMSAKTNESSEAAPPPVPRKWARRNSCVTIGTHSIFDTLIIFWYSRCL